MTDPNRIHFLSRPGLRGKRGESLLAAVATAEALGFATTVLSAPTPEGIPGVIDANRDEMQRLVIVGGDGLIHHALPSLAGTPIVVGIVPSGTGNDFARGLDIGTGLALPASKHRAVVRQALIGAPRSIDVIQSNDGRFAASVVTAGFSGRVTARANPMRFPPGQLKYTVASVLEAAQLERVHVALRADGERIELDTAFFAIGNTRYFGGGMAICPDAAADDGLLDVVIVESVPPLQLLRVMPAVFLGRHVKHPKVTMLRAQSVEIETKEPLWADGEPFGSAPVTLVAQPGALLVAG